MRKLSSTQIGAVAENLVATVLMVESDGRLSAFHPIADDDGIDLLIYDKETGRALPIQVKSRTVTLMRSRTNERGNTAHFEFRQSNFNLERLAAAVFILTNDSGYGMKCGWVIPMAEVPKLARKATKTFVVRANSSEGSKDRYSAYCCRDELALCTRVLALINPPNQELIESPNLGPLSDRRGSDRHPRRPSDQYSAMSGTYAEPANDSEW